MPGEQDTQPEVQEIKGDVATVPVQPGDAVVITLSAEEAEIIDEVKAIKEGKMPVKETEDIVDIIDNTLSLQVPAVDGATITVEIPADADQAELDDIELGVDDTVLADIMTLVGAGE